MSEFQHDSASASQGRPASPSSSSSEDERIKRARLKHMRWAATGLLLGVTVLYGLSVVFAARSAAWPYIGAFAEAAMVGALADWFAVSALFRHPLGLSFIPHTAIIPRNKTRIADNLGNFVQGEFFAPERVTTVIRDFDPAAKLAAWLADPRHADTIGMGAVKLLRHALTLLDQDTVRAFLRRLVAERFGEIDLSTLASRILHALTEDGRHQALLDQMLKASADYLNDEDVKHRVMDVLADKIPLYFKSLKESTAKYFIGKAVEFLCQQLVVIGENPAHPMRADFDRAVARLIERLETDDAFRARVKEHQRQLASNRVLTEYVDSLWHDFNAWLRNDLDRHDSVIRDKLTAVARAAGEALAGDAAMRGVVNDQVLAYVPGWIERARPTIAHFISSKMKEWRDHEIVEKLELNIGRDLQFIRLNGTLVGGMVGLAIHVVTMWLR